MELLDDLTEKSICSIMRTVLSISSKPACIGLEHKEEVLDPCDELRLYNGGRSFCNPLSYVSARCNDDDELVESSLEPKSNVLLFGEEEEEDEFECECSILPKVLPSRDSLLLRRSARPLAPPSGYNSFAKRSLLVVLLNSSPPLMISSAS
jgi:hypothetical protein